MKKPDVSITIGDKAIMQFKVLKKSFPFCTEALGDIAPQAFNANVVDAPVNLIRRCIEK